jgi:hypothetical protein
MKKIVTVMVGMFTAVTLMGTPAFAATDTQVVRPSDLGLTAHSWYFYDDMADTPSIVEVPGKYEFVAGPGGQEAGVGMLRFDTTGNERWNLATTMLAGYKVTDIKKLSFDTYQPSTNPGSTTKAMYLNFDVDFDGLGGNDAYQGRLVYVPSDNGTVHQNDWQKWLATDANAVWRWSRFASSGNQWPNGNTSETMTWSQIRTAFPSATVSGGGSVPGQLLLRAGEPYPDGFTGYLDRVTVRAGTAIKAEYDFEP